MKSPIYFPIEKGVYELSPGLKPFGFDFGNGHFDKKLFQIDDQFETFKQNKIECINDRKEKYIQRQNFDVHIEDQIGQFIKNRLFEEYQISIDESKTKLDDLILLVPEDVAVICRNSSSDWVAYLNLCSPSHWSAEGKIGKSFFDVHAPVPGIEKINRVAPAMVDAIITKGPFVRFVWSFVTDTQLNHHPDTVASRSWNPKLENPFHLRIERQVTWPFPQLSAGLFTIRISFISAQTIKANNHYKSNLESAISGMSEESLKYKGLWDFRSQILEFLQN